MKVIYWWYQGKIAPNSNTGNEDFIQDYRDRFNTNVKGKEIQLNYWNQRTARGLLSARVN